MNGPSIRKTAALSAAIHATLFLVTLLVMSHTSRLELPSPYVVSLVSPSDARRALGGISAGESSPPERTAEKRGIAMEKDTAKTIKKMQVKEEKRVEDRIAELKAMKKVERIARIRRAIIDNKVGGGRRAQTLSSTKPATAGTLGESQAAGYAEKIKAEINEYWSILPAMDKTLYAIISVKILKDGTIIPLAVEKSSGNKVFDRLMLITIKKASPVSPPPQEMERALRFCADKTCREE
jgi:TonB family protein